MIIILLIVIICGRDILLFCVCGYVFCFCKYLLCKCVYVDEFVVGIIYMKFKLMYDFIFFW